MTVPASITITPVLVADLLAEGERMPVYVHLIDHPDARVLVDTGRTGCTGGGGPRSSPPSAEHPNVDAFCIGEHKTNVLRSAAVALRTCKVSFSDASDGAMGLRPARRELTTRLRSRRSEG